MTGSQTTSGLTRQTIDEHRQIHFYLDQLERSLAGLENGVADVETLRRLAARIEGVRERLVEHFATEESGGLFRALGEALPDVRGAVHGLAEQHAHILELLDMSRIRAQYGATNEAEVLRNDIETFLRLVRGHEAQEEALLNRAARRDPAV